MASGTLGLCQTDMARQVAALGGALAPLPGALLFLGKPARFVRHKDVAGVEFDRVGASSTFDMTLRLAGGGRLEFGQLEQGELPRVQACVAERRLLVGLGDVWPGRFGPFERLRHCSLGGGGGRGVHVCGSRGSNRLRRRGGGVMAAACPGTASVSTWATACAGFAWSCVCACPLSAEAAQLKTPPLTTRHHTPCAVCLGGPAGPQRGGAAAGSRRRQATRRRRGGGVRRGGAGWRGVGRRRRLGRRGLWL